MSPGYTFFSRHNLSDGAGTPLLSVLYSLAFSDVSMSCAQKYISVAMYQSDILTLISIWKKRTLLCSEFEFRHDTDKQHESWYV